jgi:hypothetical protein
MITVLMREAVRRLWYDRTTTVSLRCTDPLRLCVCARSDGDRSVTDTPLTEA